MMIERIEAEEIAKDPSWPGHLARYLFTLPEIRQKRVLDAGIGIGYGAALMKIKGEATSVTGIDIDAQSIEKAQTLFPIDGLTFRKHDCEALSELGETFDVVVSFENIEHLQDPEAFLRGAASVLDDEGCLLISTPDRAFSPSFIEGKPTNPFHAMEWYEDEFRAMLEDYFADVDLRTQVQGHAVGQWRVSEQMLKDNFGTVEALARKSCALRISRTIKNALASLGVGVRPVVPAVQRVPAVIPRVDDFPIVDLRLAPLYGQRMCHVANCRNPRR